MGAKPFRPRTDAAERMASAKRLIVGLLAMQGQAREDQLRELLSICIWKITEAQPDHKLRTRFRSQAALTGPMRELQHEHVVERKLLIEELLSPSADVDLIVSRAKACTVTKEEHRALGAVGRANPELSGWERYRAAGIRVIDMVSGLELSTAEASESGVDSSE